MNNHLQNILELLNLAEKLKTILRHSWLSDGRQESVAEHSWRLALMAMLIAPYLDQKVNLEKMLKMIIIHDLVEAETGDIPIFEVKTAAIKKLKQQREQQAIIKIRALLADAVGEEIYALWHEYEEKNTYEAKVASALDKLEAQLQHAEADLSTWIEQEKPMVFGWFDQLCQFDSCLSQLNEAIKLQGAIKLEAAGINLSELKKQTLIAANTDS